MGLLVNLYCTVVLKENLPARVIDILYHAVNQTGKKLEFMMEYHAPTHPFFKCERWEMLLSTRGGDETLDGGVYHQKEGVVVLETYFKNHDDEVKLFLDWIRPFAKVVTGHACYEGVELEERWVNLKTL